jgi:cytidine deaminase
MRKEIIKLEFFHYDSDAELSDSDKELLNLADQAARNAYAPYSQFQVGAAVRLTNGKIIQGNNQENAAYPSGLCAERVALFYAASVYPGVAVETIAVTAWSERKIIEKPIPPCGACRQVMAEMESRSKSNMRVIMRGQSGEVTVIENLESLLPFRFLDGYLPK